MAGDGDRRGERGSSGRRDSARAARREPITIEGSAGEPVPPEPVEGPAAIEPAAAEPAAVEPSAAVEPVAAVEPAAVEPDVLPAGAAEAAPASPARGLDPDAEALSRADQPDGARETLLSGEPESAHARAERGRSNFATAVAVAVVLIAGAIIYLFYRQSFAGPDQSKEVADLSSRVSALEARPSPDVSGAARQAASAEQAATDARGALAALAKRVDAVAAPQPPQPNLQPQVADLQAAITDLRKSLATLQATVAALPRPDINRIEGRIGDLDGRLSGLQATVSAIPHVDLGPLTGKVDGLEGRLRPVEAEAEAARSPERVAERRAAPVAVTAQAVAAAIAAGQPFPAEFRALQALGADPAKLAPLQVVAADGAPSLRDLSDDLARARDGMVAQGAPAPSGSYMDRLMAGAGSLVQVRPLGSVVGDAPAAIVARMGDEIQADDLAAALADWRKLPAASQSASKALSERIKLRLDAEAAARDIAANAIGALAAPPGAPRG